MLQSYFENCVRKQVRVIIDSDANCEADDQYAIVHALMCPKVAVVGIIASHYSTERDADSMEKSYAEIKNLLHLAKRDTVKVLRGSGRAMSDGREIMDSEAARFIIEECKKDDVRPLFYISQGALTNLAAAILMDDTVCEKMLCISIGGCHYPKGGFEFNYNNDPFAAEVVMQSALPVWMVPEEAYSTMQVSLMELYQKVAPCGVLGRYLFEHLLKMQEVMQAIVPHPPFVSDHEYALQFPNGESWSLGDSCGIGILVCANAGTYIEGKAPKICPDGHWETDEGRKTIRIYTSMNSRMILEDFFARLSYFYSM